MFFFCILNTIYPILCFFHVTTADRDWETLDFKLYIMRKSKFRRFQEHILFLLMLLSFVGIAVAAFVAVKDGNLV